MRIFKGLENIHSVIDKHQAEWLREQGEESERPQRLSVEERIRRSFAETNGTGRFSADRFMGGHGVKAKEPEPELHEQELQSKSQSEPSIEIVNVIPQKDENHSWLYNEVLKAINAAIGDRKNTKVIAIFVPVVQNGKEFESLPVDETITINTAIEESPEEAHEPEIEFEPLPVQEHEETEEENESENESESEIITEEPQEELNLESVPVIEIAEPEFPEEIESELPAMGEEFNLLPEGQDEPDPELAGAYQTIEEKLDENLQESEPEFESELEIESEHTEHEDLHDEPSELPVIDASDTSDDVSEADDVMTISEGEPLVYEELELPDPLDDDDIVFDDSVFEDSLNDEDKPDKSDEEDEADKETIIIEDKENEAEHNILKKHE